ncbi:MAG TPA: metallophosphoesterase [Solirubrobacterales bacterium]
MPPKASRTCAEAAGWDDEGRPRKDKAADPGRWHPWLKEREMPKWDSFSWLTVRALFESVNDLFAKFRPEIVDERRARWIAGQRARGAARDDFVISRPSDAAERSFLLVGDTGEQDASQYAVAPYLNAIGGSQPAAEFLVIVSDVIYPAGDINEYVNGFYIPYREFEKPIYALPGNHDWYDGLDGFMYHFCGADPLPSESFRGTDTRPATRLATQLWRRSAPPERERLSRWRDTRHWARDETKAVQPAPYFAIDLGDLLLVSIDTGVTGAIDDEQGRWLLRISERPQQKILLTGKPIYVDGAYHPGRIEWKPSKVEAAEWKKEPPPFETVDDIVRYERFGYVAAIGGDVHNYQRYPIQMKEQERKEPLYYLVSGGGGAYLSTTHRIGPLDEKPLGDDRWPDGLTMPRDEDVPPQREADDPAGGDQAPEGSDTDTFHCYPQRGDSLAYTARRAGPRMFNLVQFATAAFVAATALLLFAEPMGKSGSYALATVYVPLAFLVLFFVLGGKRLKLKERLGLRLGAPSDEPWKPAPIRYALAAAFFFVVLLVALAGYAADRAYDGGLLTSGRFWGMAAVAVAMPAILIGAILLIHDLRGSTPASLPLLATTGSFAAAIPILSPFGDFAGAPQWFVTIVFVAAFMAIGTALLGALLAHEFDSEAAKTGFWRALCSTVGDVLFVAGPTLLAFALWQHTDADRVPLLAPALFFCGAWPLAVGGIAGAHEPNRLTGTAWILEELGAASRFLATAAWITVAAILIHQIGDGWIATAAIGSVAVLAILAFLGAMLALLRVTPKMRFFFSIAVAVAVLVAPLLPLPGALEAFLFVAAALVLLATGILDVIALARGELNADAAQARIRELLNEKREDPIGKGPRHLPMPEEDEPLFDLLYPYRWAKRNRGQGTEQTGNLAQTVARLLAELGDSDEPPFFKNLLRVDLRELSEDGADGADRELRIRCIGVTGFLHEEDNGAPVEDDLRIHFRSAPRFEAWLNDPGPNPQVQRVVAPGAPQSVAPEG